MKRKTKVIISLIVIVSLVCSVFAGLRINAFGKIASGDVDYGLKWSISDDGVFTVNGSGYGADYSQYGINNPRPWYSYRSKIKSVVIEDGVQAIGAYWFCDCSNLVSVELPDSLVKIGDRCFQSCTKLTNITIPENCCEYYNYIFNGCSSLKWAVLPRDNTAGGYEHTIPEYTFYNCKALENVWVGSDHTIIGANAFRSCSALQSVVWTGNSLTSIGSNFPSSASIVGNSTIGTWCSNNSQSFINLTGSCGTSLNYTYDLSDKSLTLSGSGAMASAPWASWRYFVYDVDFGGATSICESAFSGCEYLPEELTIPSGVTLIQTDAFNSTGCQTYTINADSVTVEDYAFVGDGIIFFGKRNSGVYTYVQTERDYYSDWRYYCIDNHIFGDDGKCVYCDKESNTQVLEPCGEHNFVYQYRIGNKLYYKCSECELDDYCVSAIDLLLDFSFALSGENNPYNQTNYDGRFDIVRDGIVNAKDYRIILDMRQGKPTEYDKTLTNENATDEAKALYRYIADSYGNCVISGQQESTWMGSVDYEVNYIYNKTGKYPAIRGFDFMNDDFSGVVSRAESWAARGGIVTICWHCSSAFDQSYDACKADEFTEEQWEAVLTSGTPENTAFLAGMDKAGNALLQLQAEGIPVLWRPFHEFDGAWFWWGKGGDEYFTRLWKMMYNHFTYDLGLNNLIWVLGYCHNGTDYGTDLADWYPGSRYCDIVGADSYEVSENGAEGRLFNPVYKVTGDSKPLAMHETGLIPTVSQFESVPWVYFMTWHTTWLTEDNPVSSLSAVYNSDYVITLDELPDFYN